MSNSANAIRNTLVCAAATSLGLFASAAQCVVLPPDVAQEVQQHASEFVEARGYDALDVEQATNDDAWFARFDNAGQSVFRPDADLGAVTRSMLLFVSQEAPLTHARYKITVHQRSPGGDWSDIQRSYIEITRYNLAPVHHRQVVHDSGERAAPAGPETQLPHVSWRLVTNTIQGLRANVVAASRHVLSPFEASRATCLGLPCLALGTPAPDNAAAFEPMPATDLPPPVYQGWATPPQSSAPSWQSPVRIAQELAAHGFLGEINEGASFQAPEVVMVIGLNTAGQDSNSQGLMHLTALMDDATSELWIRRRAVPGSVDWQRFAVPRQRGHWRSGH